ncbi:SGNH hydrolase, partial [Neoconidiobolus thromboides FSU 785]
QFYFIGDSLTELGYSLSTRGWLLNIQEAYIRKVDIINRGYSGYNTTWIKPIITQILEEMSSKDVRLVTLFIGANDAVTEEGSGQHVSLNEYRENLCWMINEIRKKVSLAKLILITPTPVYGDDWIKDQLLKGLDYKLDRHNNIIKKYVDCVMEVGLEYEIPTVDLWNKFDSKDTSLFTDGLHFSVKGNQILYEQWKACIENNYPELADSNLQFVYPY